MSSPLRDMFKGPTGSYDTARILFAIGGMNGVISPVAFEIWHMLRGGAWDPVAFCTAYGGMLGIILTAGGLSIATKDKGVATAQSTTPENK